MYSTGYFNGQWKNVGKKIVVFIGVDPVTSRWQSGSEDQKSCVLLLVVCNRKVDMLKCWAIFIKIVMRLLNVLMLNPIKQ